MHRPGGKPGRRRTVTVRRSKTDQEGAGTTRFLAGDTMREIAAWLAVSEINEGPLFRSVGKAGAIGGGLDAGDAARIFKKLAKAAGLAPEEAARVSGHSSRVGAAQDMVKHGVELPAVMQAGGWRTPEMVAWYTRLLDARRSGSAKLAMLQNRSEAPLLAPSPVIKAATLVPLRPCGAPLSSFPAASALAGSAAKRVNFGSLLLPSIVSTGHCWQLGKAACLKHGNWATTRFRAQACRQ